MTLKDGVMMLKIHLKYIQNIVILNCNNILQYFCFDQINAALVSIRGFFQKHTKLDPKLVNSFTNFNKLSQQDSIQTVAPP